MYAASSCLGFKHGYKFLGDFHELGRLSMWMEVGFLTGCEEFLFWVYMCIMPVGGLEVCGLGFGYRLRSQYVVM